MESKLFGSPQEFLSKFAALFSTEAKFLESFADYSGCEALIRRFASARQLPLKRVITMSNAGPTKYAMLIWLGLLLCSGCASFTTTTNGLDYYEIPKGDFATATVVDANGQQQLPPSAPPAELSKVTLPDYIIEPPDILLIEGIKVVPKSPYEIQPQDVLQIVVLGTQPERPIAGQFLVEANGAVNLGPGYGSVMIGGLTTQEAQEEIRSLLLSEVSSPEVAVTIFQASGQQFITGEHLVAPDGTVNLGLYGRVYVAGLSLDQARQAVEDRLSKYFEDPRVSMDIFVYNSKFFYIIIEGGGVGERITRLPVTGNETVLDAIATIGGLDSVSSKKIWIARPSPDGVGCDQILPVDWESVTRGASTSTNFQLLPGDRLFVAENHMVAWANLASILLNPFERVIGFGLLGAQTIQTIQRFPEGFTRGFGQ